MANAIEDALKRASPEQQAKNEQVIKEARENIPDANPKDITQAPPQTTPSPDKQPDAYGASKTQLDSNTQEKIVAIQQKDAPTQPPVDRNAVDKVLESKSTTIPPPERQQTNEREL